MILNTSEQRIAERRRRQCEGKRRYDDEAEAARVARRMRKTHKSKGVHPYECNFCGSWHVGHKRTGRELLNRQLASLVEFQRKYGR